MKLEERATEEEREKESERERERERGRDREIERERERERERKKKRTKPKKRQNEICLVSGIGKSLGFHCQKGLWRLCFFPCLMSVLVL